MSTKSYTFIPYCLQDHKVQSWKFFFFPCALGVQQSLVPRWVRYMSSKSHIHERYGTLKKTSFWTKGYSEINIQRPFFDNKNSIWKILGLKIQTVETCSKASSTCTNFYFWKKTKISIFGGISKFCLWADFDKSVQFWADFAAIAVADNMPKDHLKS
jgi:hypothetical protein